MALFFELVFEALLGTLLDIGYHELPRWAKRAVWIFLLLILGFIAWILLA